ncbi:hypothetical protein H7J73_30760, partial [Mycolicibacterium komossense]|nr:hypothetical protein [Mycolicibacterium komossense]
MSRNSAHKQAARAYQRLHPGTTYPVALRAVARAHAISATTPPPSSVTSHALPAVTPSRQMHTIASVVEALQAAREMQTKWATQNAGPMFSAAEAVRQMQTKWATQN